MIESIRVDSCIHEDPGYLLIAVQRCIMKAVHLFLSGKSEDRSVTRILSRGCSGYRLPTKSSLPPPARVLWPSTDKFMEIVSSQTSPRELHLPLCTKPCLPFSKLSVLFLNAGLHMTSLYNG